MVSLNGMEASIEVVWRIRDCLGLSRMLSEEVLTCETYFGTFLMLFADQDICAKIHNNSQKAVFLQKQYDLWDYTAV